MCNEMKLSSCGHIGDDFPFNSPRAGSNRVCFISYHKFHIRNIVTRLTNSNLSYYNVIAARIGVRIIEMVFLTSLKI
ncbi:hypothetical protein NQ315_012853 [Exocentrus adspersus]|uniref:Uncharacterized protein n=1 Tax=Exocentrus adspersus TaxID=1586481 RepID=A0AAV8V860_9CUCU|nr:hypothetical protein NQ315_012853 [Exocentrus adspersus]